MTESGTSGSGSASVAQANPVYLAIDGLPAQIEALSAQFAIQAQQAKLLLAQPDLTLAILQTLPQDQAVLAADIADYLNNTSLAGGILAALEALNTVAVTVSGMADTLQPTAVALDGGTPGSAAYQANLATWRTQLNVLPAITTSLDPDNDAPALTVQQAQTAIAALATGELADDVARFDTAITSSSYAGTITALQAQIATVQQTIAALNAEIAQGATSQIIPALMFGFKLSAEIYEADLNPGKLALALSFALADQNEKGNSFADQMQQDLNQLGAAVTQYVTLVEQLETDEQEMAVLLTIDGHVRIFHTNMLTTASVLSSLLDQLNLLNEGVQYLVTIDSSTTPSFFQDQLTQAQAAWNAIGASVTQYLQLARTLN